MPVVWEAGVPWLGKARDAASRRGLFPALNDLAIRYRAGHGSFVEYPDPAGTGVTHVQSDRLVVVLNDLGTVIAFRTLPSAAIPRVGPSAPARPVRVRERPRKAVTRGPNTWGELREWLKDEGYGLEIGGKHVRVLNRDGGLIGTLPSTPGSTRSLPNTISTLRRAGATLRR